MTPFSIPMPLAQASHASYNKSGATQIMWQRFTERARRVILLGQEEAGKMNSADVGTEHLLLGLVREDDGVSAQILRAADVTLDKVRAKIEAPINNATSGEPKLTPHAKRVLEFAADEARRLKHDYIGTEHLLLAILRKKDENAAAILRDFGLNLNDARAQVLQRLEAAATKKAESKAQFHVAPAVRQLLDLAAQEGRDRGASRLEIVHLLSAMCQPDSESARYLEAVGVDVESLRALLKRAS